MKTDIHPVLPEARVVPGPDLPLIIEPETTGLDFLAWARRNRAAIRELVHRQGGLLFRGFTEGSVETFHQFMAAVSSEPLQYQERSSPRHEVGKRVYTSTDHPADYEIYLHNEQSYNVDWPMLIFFHCMVPPTQRGATPVADCRKIFQRLSPQARDRLIQRDYLYVRHFGTGFGLSWQEAFQATDQAEVEEYCRDHDIEWTWDADGALTTRQRRPVAARHPYTGEQTWFNHLTFFNVATLEPRLAELLLSMGKEKLPNNTYYGDGTDIEPEVLQELRDAYAAERVVVPWQEGDIMMLDNMLTAHARESFTPPRRIVVGMTDPHSKTS